MVLSWNGVVANYPEAASSPYGDFDPQKLNKQSLRWLDVYIHWLRNHVFAVSRALVGRFGCCFVLPSRNGVVVIYPEGGSMPNRDLGPQKLKKQSLRWLDVYIYTYIYGAEK